MYRLRDMKNGKYQIHTNGKAFEGTLKAIVRKCVNVGLPISEIEQAIVELHNKNHDYAEFGVYRTLMYTVADRSKVA